MDIATAKPARDEMSGIPHHLIDILEPDEHFDLASYLHEARLVINEIADRGKLPILVGGSGQYVWALIEGWDVPAIEPDIELRTELEQRLAGQGVEVLAMELESISPETAKNTDLSNPRRVIRAIERVRSNTTAPVSPESNLRRAATPPYNTLIIGLEAERAVLHRRVLERLAAMLHRGWKEEVEGLMSAGHTTDDRAMSGIGYRQMVDHLEGRIDLDEAFRLTAVATNRLIRQQANWFKRDDPRIRWFDLTTDPAITTRSIIEIAQDWRAAAKD